MTYLRGLGAFWYDFLVGDRPELFAGAIGVFIVVGVAIHVGFPTTLAGPALALLVVALGAFSVWRAV